ncbi:TRAP transporter substrate-binding protein [Sulfitobacter sp. F26169L]|uniref:TRAP transporter substrate-binding protein n=1 Tax=Sulfitobacter sp. F26169L TaxID=2996015 RepID=UPI002260B733|nr:TRAP transporter substrate-binding protein [Sulfitobacter sp. F26169L]MCX7567958.1 TRAP transporter substrate-binding protein [Sulfitobacter sp. F26169L]
MSFIKTATMTALTTLALASAAAAADYKIKFAMSHQSKPNHYIYTAAEKFGEEVERLSDGRIDVEFYWGGSLGKVESVLDLMRQGFVEATFASDGHAAPYYKEIQVLSVPYLFSSRTVAWDVLGGDWGKAFSERMAKGSGLRPLSIMENGGYRHFSASTPLNTIDDLEGLKIRTQTNAVHMSIVKSLGASPTPIAWADLYTSLQTGVVEGQENSFATFRIPRLEEVQKNIIMDGHVYSISNLLVSEKFYQSLPDDLKQVLQDAAETALEINHRLSVENESSDRAYLEAEGVRIVELSHEEKMRFRDKTQGPALDLIHEQGIDPELLQSLLDAVEEAETRLNGS